MKFMITTVRKLHRQSWHMLAVLLTMLVLVSCLSGCQDRSAQQKILVYYSQGIHKQSFEDLVKFFYQNYGSKYKVEKIDDNGIVGADWAAHTALLVMPGANQFGGWKEEFLMRVLQNPKFRERIQNYVANGGSYLGICGGAMVASADFGVNSKIGNINSVASKGVKLLGLYSGKAVGPIPPMELAQAGQDGSDDGMSTIAVRYKGKIANLVYAGGPAFPEVFDNAEVAGTTTFEGKDYNVMLKVIYGKGKAFIAPANIMSGPQDWRSNQKIYESLLATEPVREEIVKDVIENWLLAK